MNSYDIPLFPDNLQSVAFELIAFASACVSAAGLVVISVRHLSGCGSQMGLSTIAL